MPRKKASPLSGGRTPATSLPVSEARSQILHEEALRTADLETINDVYRLPCMAKWRPSWRGEAVDILVSRGLLTEAADGRICVKRRSAAA